MAIRLPKPIGNGVCELLLGCGNVTLISEADAELVSICNWHSSTNGRDTLRYVKGRKERNGKLLRLHRLILGVEDKALQVDHINRDTLDNIRENLRVVTQSENMANTRRRLPGSKVVRLSASDVDHIVSLCLPANHIAELFGISAGYVHTLRARHLSEAAS